MMLPLFRSLLFSLCFLFHIFGLPAKLAQLKFSAAHLAIDLKFSLPWQKRQNLIKHLLCRAESETMSRPRPSRGEKECSKLEQTILLASTAGRVDLKQSGAYKFQAYGPMNARRCHSAVPDRAACWPQEAAADAALAAARAFFRAGAGNWRGQHWF